MLDEPVSRATPEDAIRGVNREHRGRVAKPITLTPRDRAEIEAVLRRHDTKRAVRLRAEAVLLMDDGATNADIARRTGVSEGTISVWRWRFGGRSPARELRSPRNLPPLRLTAEERAFFERVATRPDASRAARLQARAALLMAQGVLCREIARRLRVGTGAVYLWRRRFANAPEGERVVEVPRFAIIELSARDRARFETIAKEHWRPQAARRARAALLLADGQSSADVARKLSVSVNTVSTWHGRLLRLAERAVTPTSTRVVPLHESDRRRVAELIEDPGTETQRKLRARALLLMADGVQNADIAGRLGVPVPTVSWWRQRFLARDPLLVLTGVPRLARIELAQEDRARLEELARNPTASARRRTQAQGTLLLADHVAALEVAERVNVSREAVYNWHVKLSRGRLGNLLTGASL